MTQPAPHQQRVLDEKRELDERLSKLDAFILDNPLYLQLPGDEQGRLSEQSKAMAAYSGILDERIAAFCDVAHALPITLPVIDPGPDSLEREIQAKANKGPRVTPAALQAEIVSAHYFTAYQGAKAELQSDGVAANAYEEVGMQPLRLLTFCVLVLRNGFTVHGISACASPENYNEEIGQRIARENAEHELWPLLGFRLRDELAGI